MQFLNGNIYKKQNGQQKAKTSNQRHFLVLGLELQLILSHKQERATKSSKSNERQIETGPKNQNEQQKATKSIFTSHFQSFASILDPWKVVDIKRNEKLARATTSNEKQQKAVKSNKKQKRTSQLEKPKQTIKGTKIPNGNQALAIEKAETQCQ